MPGLGSLFTRGRTPLAGEQHTRAITEFAIIDGVAVDGSGEIGARYRGGMSIPGAWRASILISDLLGSVPWDAYDETPGRPIEKLTPTPPLLEQPSPPDTRMTTISSLALDLLWNGNAVEIIAARSPFGWPTATLPVPAGLCGVRRVTESSYSPLPVGTIEYNIGGLSFAPWEVIHTKGPCEPGALKGMGVLDHHMNGGALGLAQEQMRQAANLANHGVPTGYLKSQNPDTTDPELRDMKAGWLRNQRDRTVAALNSTTEFVPLSWNPEQMQLVEARRYTLTDLELIFGLPVGWLGGMNSARQYSNIEQDAVNLLKFSLGGHLTRFEQARSLAFPRGTTVTANLGALLRADTLARYQAYAIGLDKEFLTADEVRAAEKLAPLQGTEDQAAAARALAEASQKIYLAVTAGVLTKDEARTILNRLGGHLVVPMPATTPTPAAGTDKQNEGQEGELDEQA
jgi:phage portal protein BeeE